MKSAETQRLEKFLLRILELVEPLELRALGEIRQFVAQGPPAHDFHEVCLLDLCSAGLSPSTALDGPEEVVVTPEKVVEVKAAVVPDDVKAFNERKTFLVNEIPIESDSIRLTFYDNGDIDGDSISVYYNKVPVLSKQALSAQGINLYLKLDPQTRVHEFSMFAENLGSIPPNTALMVIHDGNNRHEVFMTSSLSLNATVILRRK